MFANLYRTVKSLHFQDHNFREWPPGHGIEKIPESHIVQLIKGCCDVPDRHKDERAYHHWVEHGFELRTIFQQTLCRRSCVGFFRAEPDLPAVKRDYYLSKLYQFLWLIAMECHEFLLRVHRDWALEHWVDVNTTVLENFLDALPEESLPDQLAEFDWESFRNELCTVCKTRAIHGDLLETLGDLRRFLPSPAAPTERPRSLQSDVAHRQAMRSSVAAMTFPAIQEWWSGLNGPTLLKNARSARGHVQKEAAQACGVGLETYKKWESGRTPSKSNIPGVVDYIEAAPANIFVQPPGH
jgi:hypothetical protein